MKFRIFFSPLLCLLVFCTTTSFQAICAEDDSRNDIVIAVNKLPRTLDPADRSGNIEVRVHYSIFDTLIRRDYLNKENSSPKLLPGLAESWKRIDDRTVDITLRRGVTFHNGDILTAADVVFTFSKERILSDKIFLRSGRLHFGHLEKVVKLDDYTIRFVTKHSDPLLEQRLAGYAAGVINARSWLKYNNGQPDWLKRAFEANKWNPVGTGPLKFKERQNKKKLVFTSHDSYFQGKPNFKSVTFVKVPKRISRVAGLVGEKYDIIVDVAPERIQVIKQYPGLDARSVILDNAHVLAFNTTSPKLKDKRLRQALSLAINREELRKELWNNSNYTPNGHQLPSFGSMYNPQRSGYRYDREEAGKLLKESGYRGEILTYRLIPDYYLHSTNAALMILEMWRKIGVRAKLETVENWKQVRDKNVEIYAWSNTFRLPDPAGAFLTSWGPRSNIQAVWNHWQPSAEFNKLAQVVEQSSDENRRFRAFQRMLDIFEDDMPGTILYSPLYTYGIKSYIDWTPYPLYYMDFRPNAFSVR